MFVCLSICLSVCLFHVCLCVSSVCLPVCICMWHGGMLYVYVWAWFWIVFAMWSLCMWHPWLQRTGTLAQIASQLAETTRPLTKVVWKLGGSEEVLRVCAIYCLVPENDAFHLKWLKLAVFCLICVSYHPRSSLSMQNSMHTMEIHGMSLAEVCMWSFWSGNFPVKWWSACEAQSRFDGYCILSPCDSVKWYTGWPGWHIAWIEAKVLGFVVWIERS